MAWSCARWPGGRPRVSRRLFVRMVGASRPSRPSPPELRLPRSSSGASFEFPALIVADPRALASFAYSPDVVPTQTPEPDAPGRRSALAWTGAAALLYVTLAIASTWPLATRLSTSLPLHRQSVQTVPLALTWALAWNARWLASFEGSYWGAPIFHPTPSAFAFSEPMPLLGAIGAPLAWAGASPALVHNALLWLALALNGWFGYRLLLALGLHRGAALAGGAGMLTIPMLQREIGVLTLVPLAGILASLQAAIAFGRSPRWQSGLGLGVALELELPG